MIRKLAFLLLLVASQLQAAPTLESWTAANNPGFVTSITLNAPSGINAGDLLLAIVCDDYGADANAQWDGASNKPTGFDLVTAQAAGLPAYHNVAIFKREATGTEGSTLVVPNRSTNHYGVVGWYLRISGADTGPVHKTGAWVETAVTGSTINITGVTTTVDDALALYVQCVGNGTSHPFTPSGTGWSGTEIDEEYTGVADTTEAAGSFGVKAIATAGATETVTITMSGVTDYQSGIQIAIAPAAQSSLLLRRRR